MTTDEQRRDPNKPILDHVLSIKSIDFIDNFLHADQPAREGGNSVNSESFPIPYPLPLPYLLLTTYYLFIYLFIGGVGVKNTSIQPNIASSTGWMTHLWMNLGVYQNIDIL
jgi:hypothetical protein